MFGSFVSRIRNAMKIAEAGPVRRIDHIMIHSSDPENLFKFFTDTLQLPMNWPFQEYGGYVCGGVFVGNTVLEIIKWVNLPYDGPAYPQGLALEPWELVASHATTKKRSIPMKDPFVRQGELSNGKTGRLYTNVVIPSLMDEGDCTFFCDFSPPVKERKRLRVDEQGPSSAKPLGVVRAGEVVFVQKDVEKVIAVWEKFMAPLRPLDRGLWEIDGTQVRFLPANGGGSRSLTLNVGSIPQAADSLDKMGVQSEKTSPIEIKLLGSALQGLNLFLKEDPSFKESNPYAPRS